LVQDESGVGGGGIAVAENQSTKKEEPTPSVSPVSSSGDSGVSTSQNKDYSPTHLETKSGTAAASASVVSALLTGVNDQLYLAAISVNDNTISVSSVSGLGLTWNLILRQCSNADQLAVEVWYAIGTVSGDGQVTANFSGPALSSEIAVSRYSRVDTASPIGNTTSGNFHGVSGACGMPGTNSNSYSFSLTTSTNDSIVYSATSFSKGITHSAVSSTERTEISAGSNPDITNLVIQERVASTQTSYTIDGAFSAAARWAVVGIEIKPAQ
jgi:hypothetical protein